jgi:hypothetical protein
MSLFDYNRVYQAYSGSDMIAHINHKPVGSLQALTVSITREVVPIYTMGDPNPKCYVKGKRGIAGSLSFSTFDRHALLYDVFRDDANPERSAWFTSNLTRSQLAGKGVYYATDVNGNLINNTNTVSTSAGGDKEVQDVLDAVNSRKLRYSDELPPFNITLTMVNDFGSASTAHINGVVLINEGYAYTMDDLTNEMSFTYVAREVTPLSSLSSGMFASK